MALQIDSEQVRSTAAARAELDPNWREPLERAAEMGKDKGHKATLHTPWLHILGPDAEYQHQAYALHLHGVLLTEKPDLLALLRDAAAYVFAWPGCFMFKLPEDPSKGYLIDELSPQTFLVPWATSNERGLPQ